MMVVGAVSGLQLSLGKIGSQHAIAPTAWMLFVNGVGASVLLGIAAWRGTRPTALLPHARYAFWAGLSAVAFPNTLIVLLAGHIPVGLVAVLNTMSPLMTYALALALGVAAVHRLRVAGLGCGVAGALMVLLPRTSLPDPAMWPWVLLCLLVPMSYAVSSVYVARHRPAAVDSIALAGAMQLASFCLSPPPSLWTGVYLPLPPAHAGDWALLMHAAMSWIGSLLFFEVVRLAGPVFFSQVGFLITLWGVFWGWLLFGETHSAWVWGAMLAIFAGLALVTRAGR